MFRKTILALSATVALTAAALSSTSAFAGPHGGHGGGFHGGHGGFHGGFNHRGRFDRWGRGFGFGAVIVDDEPECVIIRGIPVCD